LPTQLVRFAAIGVASTLANLVLFLLFRTFMGPIWANVVALLLTTIANTAANRRLTFGVRGRQDVAKHQFQGLIVFGLGLGLTTGALALLGALVPGAHQSLEVVTIVVANLVATVLRFVLFRAWVFRGRTRTATAEPVEVPSEIAA
jgi:putative flippase GtrA